MIQRVLVCELALLTRHSRRAEWFVAFAMCLLGLQKLKDFDGLATMYS